MNSNLFRLTKGFLDEEQGYLLGKKPARDYWNRTLIWLDTERKMMT
jgi:hypothetical protein